MNNNLKTICSFLHGEYQPYSKTRVGYYTFSDTYQENGRYARMSVSVDIYEDEQGWYTIQKKQLDEKREGTHDEKGFRINFVYAHLRVPFPDPCGFSSRESNAWFVTPEESDVDDSKLIYYRD